MRFSKVVLFIGFWAFLFYFGIMFLCMLLGMFDIAVFMALFLIFAFSYMTFRRIVFMKYGTKKEGYIIYYNDYTSHYSHNYFGHGTGGLFQYSTASIDVIVDDKDGEKRVHYQGDIEGFNTEKFLEIKTSGKTIYIDVYVLWKFYYVDCKSVRVV